MTTEEKGDEMAKHPGKSISVLLDKAEVMITNSLLDSVIQGLVAGVGYGLDRLKEGKALLVSATAIKDTHIANTGAQRESTAAAKKARKEAIAAYQSYSTLAKGELKKSRESLTKLGLNKRMPRTEAGFIAAGKTLFDNAMSDTAIKTTMAKYGYDDAKLTGENVKILAYESANDVQKAAEGASQDSTDTQSKVMKELQDWMAQYAKAARIALKDKKQLLEKLGIRARTTKTRAQRQAPLKAAATKKAKKNKSSSDKQG